MNGLQTLRYILRAPRVHRNYPNHQCAESFLLAAFALAAAPSLISRTSARKSRAPARRGRARHVRDVREFLSEKFTMLPRMSWLGYLTL